jgi:hypothetical protein
MKRRRLLVASVVLLPVPVLAGVAVAGWRGPFQRVVPPTKRFKDIDTAIAAGYSFRLPDLAGNTCIEQPGMGGMGVHQVNTSPLDGTIDANKPEALVYAPTGDDGQTMRLVALEYVVFQSDWHGAERPSLFGNPFDFVPAPNRYGLPAFYALHAWIYEKNPSGLVFAWNPRISCSMTHDHGGSGTGSESG